MSRIGLSVLLLIFAAPIFLLISTLFFGESQYFHYFLKHGLISEYLTNSFVITILTAIISFVIAVPAAWWITFYEFHGKKTLEWALVLPLAVPPYLAAIVYGTLLEGAGPVQYWLRDVFQMQYGSYWFPQIRSIGGMSLILAFTIYPYLYMLARTAFMSLSPQIIDSGILLGLSRKQILFKLILPLCRPALIAGLALIIMETLADFGVASLFGIPVFTTGIYRAWNSFYDPIAAGRIAVILLTFVLTILWIEKVSRGQKQFSTLNSKIHTKNWPLKKSMTTYIYIHCFCAIFIGFLLPLGMLAFWSIPNLSQFTRSDTLEIVYMSFIISTLTGFLVVAIGTFTAYSLRRSSSMFINLFITLSNCGYAIPGTVIAVAVLLVLITLQNIFFTGELILTGTIFGILWGCSLRFSTIGFKTINSGLNQITQEMDEIASLLGFNAISRLMKLHLPLLRNSLLISFILVFIETLKELPATLLLRPFDINTLAIKVYEYANDEMVELAAPMGLLLIIMSIIPVIFINSKLKDGRFDARN